MQDTLGNTNHTDGTATFAARKPNPTDYDHQELLILSDSEIKSLRIAFLWLAGLSNPNIKESKNAI